MFKATKWEMDEEGKTNHNQLVELATFHTPGNKPLKGSVDLDIYNEVAKPGENFIHFLTNFFFSLRHLSSYLSRNLDN